MSRKNEEQHGTEKRADGVVPPLAATDGNVEPPQATQNKSTQDDSSEDKKEKAYSQQEVDAMLSKIRGDEKSKHQGKLEDMKVSLKKQSDEMKALEARLSGAAENLDKLEGNKKDAKGDMLKELEKLREDREKLEKAIEEMADLSAQQIVDVELGAKKEMLVLKYGIKFPELVSGSTVKELEASAVAAAKREQELVADAAKAAAERTKATLTKEAADSLPEPIEPNQSLGNGNDMPSSFEERDQIVRLPRDQYRQKRAELIREAKRKVGLA